MSSLQFFLRLFGGLIFAAAILAAPWFYGGITLFGQKWVDAGILIGALAALPSLFLTPRMIALRTSPGRLTLLGLPLLLALLLGFLQTIPLSPATLRTVSPHVPELAAGLLPAPGSEEEQIERSFFDDEKLPAGGDFFPSTVSVSPSTTRDAIALLAFCVLAYFTAGILFRATRPKRFFWGAITLAGAILALFSMITRAAPDDGFWTTLWPSAHYGPYVNPNNAAGYLCLCLGPAVALFSAEILHARRRIKRSRPELPESAVYHKSFWERLADPLFDLIDSFSRRTAGRLALVAILLAGALISLSRGGSMAAIFALAVSLVVLTRRGKAGLFSVILWAAAAVGMGLIGWSGMTERVSREMQTIIDVDSNPQELNGRTDNWRGAYQTMKDYRFRGSGYGAYAIANRPNDFALRNNGYCEYAENLVVESALVGGWPLLVILLLGAVFWVVALWRAIRCPVNALNRGDPDDEACDERELIWSFGLGTLTLFAGQLISASLDFGLQLPANAILASAILGSFAAGETLREPSENGYGFQSERFGRLATMALAIFFLASLCAAWVGWRRIATAESVERTIAECNLETEPQNLDLYAIDLAISELEAASAKRPDDARIHKAAAEAGIVRFRFLLWQQMKAELPDAIPSQLWERATPEANLVWIMMLERRGMQVGPEKFRNSLPVTDSLRPALRHLLIARRLLPIDPNVHYLCALLTPLVTATQNTDALLRTAAQRAISVSRMETKVCCQAGLLLYWSGDVLGALPFWRDSLTLSPRYTQTILACLNEKKNRRQLEALVDRAFPYDFALLEYAVNITVKPAFSETRKALLAKMEKTLSLAADKESSAEWYRNRGRWHTLCERPDEAILDYRHALPGDNLHPDWDYELGMIYLAQKNRAEAIAALRAAVIRAPGNKRNAAALKRAEALPE